MEPTTAHHAVRCRISRTFGFFYLIGQFAAKIEWFFEIVRAKLKVCVHWFATVRMTACEHERNSPASPRLAEFTDAKTKPPARAPLADLTLAGAARSASRTPDPGGAPAAAHGV